MVALIDGKVQRVIRIKTVRDGVAIKAVWEPGQAAETKIIDPYSMAIMVPSLEAGIYFRKDPDIPASVYNKVARGIGTYNPVGGYTDNDIYVYREDRTWMTIYKLPDHLLMDIKDIARLWNISI